MIKRVRISHPFFCASFQLTLILLDLVFLPLILFDTAGKTVHGRATIFKLSTVKYIAVLKPMQPQIILMLTFYGANG